LFARTQVDCYISGHHHAFFYSEKKGVKMIFAGALGSGPRKYIGCDAKPVKTFSKLLFDRKNKKIRAVTFAPAKGMQNIISSDLPAYIKNFYNRLERIEDQLLR
jgi:predicted phosphodiesterase